MKFPGNLTERSRKILMIAGEESVRLQHEYIGTEHLLLGLIREGEGLASAVLQNLDVDLDAVTGMIEETVKPGRSQLPSNSRPYTSRASKVMELAHEEAQRLRHSYVGTEHLLLGLILEQKGIAAQVLAQHGVDIERARGETLRLLGSEVPLIPQAHGATAERQIIGVSLEVRYADGSVQQQEFPSAAAAIDFLRR